MSMASQYLINMTVVMPHTLIKIHDGYINISQTEVLTWVLGYNKTIEELIEQADQVNVVAHIE